MRWWRPVARRGLALLTAGLVLLNCGGALDRQGVVTGGIIPCSGLSISSPHYAAGTVTVLRGHIIWTGNDQTTSQFPSTVVAKETVDVDSTYRFVLDPGDYVLQAGISWASIDVQPGEQLYVDIPNRCI